MGESRAGFILGVEDGQNDECRRADVSTCRCGMQVRRFGRADVRTWNADMSTARQMEE